MRITESMLRRIIREELGLNERSEIELLELDGGHVAQFLRDAGHQAPASVILNPDRPGVDEYLWEHVLKKGKESQRTWRAPIPLEKIGYHGMSLHDMGFRDGIVETIIGLSFGQPPIYDWDPDRRHARKLVDTLIMDVNFYITNPNNKKVQLGELRGGGILQKARTGAKDERASIHDFRHFKFAPENEFLMNYIRDVSQRRAGYLYT